ncbi:hypothetical protein Tco_1503368 [Tanacetum coccineum]
MGNKIGRRRDAWKLWIIRSRPVTQKKKEYYALMALISSGSDTEVLCAVDEVNTGAVCSTAVLWLVGRKGKLLLSPQQVVIGDQKDTTSGKMSPNTMVDLVLEIDYPPLVALQNKGIVDSGCSRHMTGNKAYLAEYQDFNGGPVAFGGSKGYITGKGKIKTGKLDFEDVCFVKELQHFNLFSVSQMCDKKNKVLFTDSECLVLSPEFKLPDENQVLLRIPRQNNMYSFNLENIVPSGGNLVRGLPSKIFQNDHTCVACQKGKQHKASCKAKSDELLSHSLQLLHDGIGISDQVSYKDRLHELVTGRSIAKDARLKRQEKDADAAEALRKEFAQQIKDLLLHARAAKPSSTNIVNIASTLVSTASTDSDLPNPDQDDSEIPALEEIYKTPTDGKKLHAVQDSKVWILVDFLWEKAIGTKWFVEIEDWEKRSLWFTNKVKVVAQDIGKRKVKDEEASDVDVHLYRSMIGSLMYLTASRPDIMFVVLRKSIGGCLIFLAVGLISGNAKKQSFYGTFYYRRQNMFAACQLLWQVFVDSIKCRFQFLVYAEAFLTIGDEFQEVHWVSRVLGKRYRRYCNIAVAKLVQFFIGTS